MKNILSIKGLKQDSLQKYLLASDEAGGWQLAETDNKNPVKFKSLKSAVDFCASLVYFLIEYGVEIEDLLNNETTVLVRDHSKDRLQDWPRIEHSFLSALSNATKQHVLNQSIDLQTTDLIESTLKI